MIKRRSLCLLSGLTAALALLPASAHGASSCNQRAPGVASGAGQCSQQVSVQRSTSTQAAESQAEAKQDVTSANLPLNVATHGSVVTSADNSADQGASNNAASRAGNETHTSQASAQTQHAQNWSCLRGCGGESQSQLSFDQSTTTQRAESEARAEQSGTSLNSAASNNATSSANNNAGTTQSNNELQVGASSSCSRGCDGDGQSQVSVQKSTTTQAAESQAEAKQDVTSANLPVDIATPGSVATNGDDSADRHASNNAESSAGNEAQTSQSNEQRQDRGSSSCCGGHGQVQVSFEQSTTTQRAESQARAEQSATKGFERDASNTATRSANDNAGTKQGNHQSQDGGSSSCSVGCGVNSQAQLSVQKSMTTQAADAANNAESSANEAPTSQGNTASAAAESNATIQLIWQVQLSECIVHCSGAQQSQIAEQRNTAAQLPSGPSHAGGAHGTEATENSPRAEESLTQIKLGCVSHCFGTTTTTPAPMLASYAHAVEAVLRAIGVDISNLAGAAEQNTVEQISYQSQRNPRGVPVQTQSASQASTSVQESDPSPPMAGLQNAPERSAASRPGAVNGTVQGIWQLQVGCVMFCNETALYQSAAQSSSPALAVAAPRAVSSPASSSANSTTQLIWQAQIGCLFWCFDATEQQTAPGQNTPTGLEGDGTPAPPSAEPPAQASGEAPASSVGLTLPLEVTNELTYAATLVREMLGPEAAALLLGAGPPQPAPAAASPSSSVAETSPTSSGAGTVLPPSPPLPPAPAPALQGRAMLIVRPVTDSAPRHLPASPPHRPAALATYSFAPHPATVQLAGVAPRADVPRSTAGLAAVAQVHAVAGAGLSDTAPSSGANVRSEMSLATLLSGFALCGLCVFGIALAAARRDPRASKPGAGG